MAFDTALALTACLKNYLHSFLKDVAIKIMFPSLIPWGRKENVKCKNA